MTNPIPNAARRAMHLTANSAHRLTDAEFIARLQEHLKALCPHCARDLESAGELAAGVCDSDDCPRHSA